MKAQLGLRDDSQDDELRRSLDEALKRIQTLTGRSFGVTRSGTLDIKINGLPFVEVPDLHVAGRNEFDIPAWPVPDPIHPEYAQVLQVNRPYRLDHAAGPLSSALRRAGEVVAAYAADDGFQRAVLYWLAAHRERGGLESVLRSAMDPDVRVDVPVIGLSDDGWWIQISRRLQVITQDTPDEQRLLEVLVQPDAGGAVTATEPLVIIARLTEHPVTWAMSVRVWVASGTRPGHLWRIRGGADAIHRYGIPIVGIDAASSAAEVTAQLLLASRAHGYLVGEDDEIPAALSDAFPREVARIRAGTDAPDTRTAAIRLFDRLRRRGFDPSCSAETMRRYVRRQASTICLAARQEQRIDLPWRDLGISEGYYYKLLRRAGVPKGADGRYVVDETVTSQLARTLDARGSARERRAAALAYLVEKGFSKPAARKWIQRHPLEGVLDAQPWTATGGHRGAPGPATSDQARRQ